MTDLEDARKRWLEEKPLYERFGKVVESRIQRAVQAYGIWCVTTARAKELDSLIKKLITKRHHTYETLPDKAGARCVVRYSSELPEVVEAAKGTFECSKIERKAEGLGVERLGYNGIHMEVRLRADDSGAAEFKGCCAELQVKTLGQQLWSEMSHDTVYKNDESISKLPDDYRRRVNLMAGLIEVADREFDRLNVEYPRDDARDVYRALERHYFRLTARRPDTELSLDIIRLLLPLYDSADVISITKRLEEFLSDHQDHLAAIYAQEERELMSVLMFQPEALLLYERLDHDVDATRQLWVTRYPDRELERVANAFGMSFD